MDAMKIAGAKIWLSSAIILDFRELSYKWGDTMQCLFQSPYPKPSSPLEKIFAGPEKKFHIVAVTSPLNQKGLTSLIQSEMGKNPSKLLFDSLETAVKSIETELLKQDSATEIKKDAA